MYDESKSAWPDDASARPPPAPVGQPGIDGIEYAPIARPANLSQYPSLNLGWREALLDLLGVFGLMIGAEILLGGAVRRLIERYPESGIFLLNTMFGVFTIVAVGLFVWGRHLRASSLGLSRPNVRMVIGALVLGIPACFLAAMAGATLYVWTTGSSMDDIVQQREGFFALVPDPSIMTFVLFAGFTGFHEELLFRGFALPRLCVILRSRFLGVIACSIIFGLVHGYQGAVSIYQTAMLSVVFCGLVLLSRSLWPAVLVHAAFNAINFALIPIIRDHLPELLERTS
ncbi:MAG TPA: type II CAAX endopeptidase family protein [Phycisphaerae bacterium]|nr:type II CAAX endopeptidase family protein [Phycisphaerae bacterium]